MKLQELVVTDHLTGLRNRRGFEEALSRAPDPSGTCVLLIDLDNFKRVNDQLGHDAGDAVLAEVGARLALHARRGDVIARLGGDEFALILFDTYRTALSPWLTPQPDVQYVVDPSASRTLADALALGLRVEVGF